MMSALKAEFKKLLSVRSTYGWILVALVFLGIYGIYGEGFKDSAAIQQMVQNHSLKPGASLFIAGTITQISSFVAIFGAIIALLLMAHEYRYNTIAYTLTASNSRTKVLAAKILAVLGFTFVYSALMTLIGIGMIYIGLALSHNVLPHQDVNYLTYLAKSVFYAEGYALAALVFAAIIRNLVGSFVALLVVPGPVEALLTLLLKSDSVYLPFMALSQVIAGPTLINNHPAHPADHPNGYLSAPKGAVVFLIYLAVGWLIAWYLFLRRDATKLD